MSKKERNFDIVIIDDNSEDGTIDKVQEHFPDVFVVGKQSPKGLTHSWNLAYQIFKVRISAKIFMKNYWFLVFIQ
jgi:glycosyltransferase involved in cell wall biosynthesis